MARVHLSDDRRAGLVRELQAHYLDHHDEEIGELKANSLIDFFLDRLAPPVFDQAIGDARKFLQERLDELEDAFLIDPEDGAAGIERRR